MMKSSKLLKILGASFLSVGAFSVVGVSISHSVNTPAEQTEAEDYYASISDSLTGSSLLTALNKLNSSKRSKTMGYDGMRSKYQYVDTCDSANGKVVGFYNNALVGPAWDSGSTWNREHVWPKSLGGDQVEADGHMARPASTSINSERGNMYYSTDKYDPGQFVAEYRGIAARIIFYCAIADTDLTIVDANSGSSTQMGKLSDLLKWNLQYLPNSSSSATLAYKTEQNRNEVLASSSYQGNRNPFIDHPEYACKIWGNTNSTTQSICASATYTPSVSLSETNVSIAPGSSKTITATINNGSGTITWTTSNSSVATVSGGTISIPSTATDGQTATITASVTISGTTYSNTCTVTVSSSGSSGGEASSISNGDEVVLICKQASMEMTSISTTSTKYGIGTSYSTTPACTTKWTVGAGSATGTYSLKNGNNYLSWSSGNSLTTSTTLNANSSWSISIDSDDNATIANAADSTRVIWWNNSSPRFACYTSAMYAVQLYKVSSGSSTTKTLSSITVKTAPTKVSYTAGDTFDPTGLVITATYSDSSTADISYSSAASDFSFSPSTSTALTVSNTSVTITYGGKSCSQPITVTAATKTLSSISVATAPTKTSYSAGDTFDPTGLVINRNYSDSTSDTYTYANHTSEFTFNPSTSTALTTANTSVTITYGGKSTAQAITVTSSGGEAQSGSVSFIPSDFSGQGTSGTGSDVSATKSPVTFTCDKGYGTTQLRCYTNGVITISSEYTITQIDFTFSGSNTGGLETSYTGLSTKSWSKTLTSQARITECAVTYEETGGSGGDTPTLVTTYDLVTDGLSDGDKVVIVAQASRSSTSGYAMKNALTSNGYYVDYVSASMSNGKLTKTDTMDVWTVGKSGNSYTFYSNTQSKYLYGYLSGTYKNLGYSSTASSGATWSVEENSGTTGYDVTTTVSGTVYLEYYNSAFKIYTSAGEEAINFYRETVTSTQTAASWGSTFLTTVTCDGGSTAPSTTAWSTMQTAYNLLSQTEKDNVLAATASESGTDLQKAIARYVFIVNKYTNRTNYPDYLSKASSSNRINLISMNDSSTLLVVIATATCLIGMTFITLSIKKRKEK